MRLCLGAILLMLASLPVQAQSPAADPQLLWPLLQERLAAVDAAAGDGDAAALERLQARQALQALPEVRSRDRAFATGIAEHLRVYDEYAVDRGRGDFHGTGNGCSVYIWLRRGMCQPA